MIEGVLAFLGSAVMLAGFALAMAMLYSLMALAAIVDFLVEHPVAIVPLVGALVILPVLYYLFRQ